MNATDAVERLIEDHGDVGTGFRGDFAADRPVLSFLQRTGMTLDDALELFDWREDAGRWLEEYKGGKETETLVRMRRRASFSVCGWREMREDFGRGDVSCLREARTPLVTSRSPLRAARDEFDESGGSSGGTGGSGGSGYGESSGRWAGNGGAS